MEGAVVEYLVKARVKAERQASQPLRRRATYFPA
jgi:hypothetical protein